MSSVFDGSETKQFPQWFKPQNVGDRVEGTYVDYKVQIGSKNFPSSVQMIYTLKRDDGVYVNVSHGISHLIIHDKMQNFALGQKVGFLITGSKEKQIGEEMKTSYYWDVKSNGEIDQEWVNANQDVINAHDQSPVALALPHLTPVTLQKMKEVPTAKPVIKIAPTTNVEVVNNTATPTPPPATATPPTSDIATKLNEITELAKKFGAADAEGVKKTVIEKTGLEFITANLDAILEKMRALDLPF